MLVIFADDLTGALDAAAPFAGRGLRTEVALDFTGVVAALRSEVEVLSVNLGCRDGSEEEARRANEQLMALLPAGAMRFKKVDSRLKGHIAAELDVTPFRRAFVAPAIPDFGRLVARGAVCGFGVETPIPVREKLGRHATACTVPDIATQAEMRAALAAAREAGIDLLVGARGLAEALAQAMTGRTQAAPAAVARGRGLFVIGSRDPITLAQVDALAALPFVETIAAPNGVVAPAPGWQTPLRLVQATQGAGAASPQEVSERLSQGVVPAFTQDAATLLLSGGATAEAMLKRMGVSRLRLLGECLPGLGVAQTDSHCIVAKSGGFGQADTLKDMANMMLERTD